MPDVERLPRAATPLATRWRERVDAHVMAACWADGGRVVAALSIEGGLTSFRAATGAPWFQRTAHSHGGTSLAAEPQGEWIVTGGQDGVVRVWHARTGEPLWERATGQAWVERVAWNAAGTLVAAAAGRAVHVWQRDGTPVRVWPTHRATVTDVQWHPSDDRLCATSYGGVTVLDPAVPAPAAQFAWQGSSLCARWSPDGRFIATGEQDASVHFWVVKTGKDLQMTGYPTKIRELAWDAGSRNLATGGGPEVAVWDCGGKKGPAGTSPTILPGHTGRVSALAYQRRGPHLASGGTEGRVVVWDPAARAKLVAATEFESGITALAWSDSDRDLLIAAADGTVGVGTI